LGSRRRPTTRGVSELVIILALIAVVVPLIMVLQSWLSSRAGALESVTVVQPLVGYLVGRNYSGNNAEVITVGIRNQARDTFTIASVRAVLSNGSVVGASVISPTTPPQTISISPGGEIAITVRVNTGFANVRTTALVVSAKDSTNRIVELTINIG